MFNINIFEFVDIFRNKLVPVIEQKLQRSKNISMT